MLKRSKLRRPFSRRIGIGTDRILTTVGRCAFFEEFGGLVGREPLATALAIAARAYGGEYEEARRLTELIGHKGFAPTLEGLHREADLRKFLLFCFREHFTAARSLSRPLTAALLGFSAVADPDCRTIYRASGPSGPSRPPVCFEYVKERPRGLRIAIYIRTYFYGPTSRPHDLGPRLKSAFDGEGVECKLVDPDMPDLAFEPSDLALVDDTYVHRKDPAKRRQFLERLSEVTGTLAMLEMDPWAAGLDGRIDANRDLYDFVWTMAPTLSRDGGRTIAGLPVTFMPFPCGAGDVFERFTIDGTDAGRAPIKFCGAVEEYNFYRYFWLLASAAFETPPALDVTNHEGDGLYALASLARYVERLSGSYACLNFTMRGDGRRAVVGRSSDSLRLEQLLVQERADDMHAYLEPGVQYLEFDTVDELEEICARLARDAAAFESVRQEGVAAFTERYADEAVVRHLATFV